MKKTILIVALIFAGVLIASVAILLFTSSDFSGFGKEPLSEPVVTRLPSEPANGDQAPGKEGKEPYKWQDHPVFVIGDSLTLGAKNEIIKAVSGFTDITVDGKNGRNMSSGASILKGWQDDGTLPDDAIIVVCLAHNITDSTVRDAEKIVEMIKPGQSLIMMTGHGRSSMLPINEYLRNLPNEYTYIAVADWDLTIIKSPSLLSDDGIHIGKRQGNELYATLILWALEVAQPMPE